MGGWYRILSGFSVRRPQAAVIRLSLTRRNRRLLNDPVAVIHVMNGTARHLGNCGSTPFASGFSVKSAMMFDVLFWRVSWRISLCVVCLAAPCLCQPRREPPVPIWQPWMETDARYQKQYVFLSRDLSEIILRYHPVTNDGPSPDMAVLQAEVRNRITPVVSVQVSAAEAGGGYRYRYVVSNRPTVRDACTLPP